jgi:vacuolar-type H+-ATPase subunit H
MENGQAPYSPGEDGMNPKARRAAVNDVQIVLSPLASFLLDHADGTRSVDDLGALAAAASGEAPSREAVFRALDELSDHGLLEARLAPPAGRPFTRRAVGLAAAAAAAALFMPSLSEARTPGPQKVADKQKDAMQTAKKAGYLNGSDYEQAAKQAESEIKKHEKHAESEIKKAEKHAESEIKKAEKQAESEIKKAGKQAESEIKKAENSKQAESEIKKAGKQAESEIKKAERHAESEIKKAERHAESEIKKVTDKL